MSCGDAFPVPVRLCCEGGVWTMTFSGGVTVGVNDGSVILTYNGDSLSGSYPTACGTLTIVTTAPCSSGGGGGGGPGGGGE